MLGAETMWGLMAPVGKFVLSGAVVTPLILTDCRMIGAACLFWIASIFTKQEHVNHKDMLSMFFAALLGIVFNQGSYLFGLGLTTPINASIVTTSLPILTMIIAAIYLREPITGKKLLGVFMGAIGALLLILSGQRLSGEDAGSIWGILLCLFAQFCFSLYLVFFKGKDIDSMTEAFRIAARENDALLAEVGQRFYQLADTLNLYAADGVHPSEAGSRLAAETIAAVIQTHKETQS